MTDISFLTESVTEVDRCCKEIRVVGIDLPECCLGTECNLLTAAAYYEGMLDVAGASRVTAPRALALSHTPKMPHTPADPPSADPAEEPAPAPAALAPATPALAGVRGRAEARAGGVPTQGRGQRRSPRARRWQITLIVLDEHCAVTAVVCRTRITMQFPAEFHLRPAPDNLTNL